MKVKQIIPIMLTMGGWTIKINCDLNLCLQNSYILIHCFTGNSDSDVPEGGNLPRSPMPLAAATIGAVGGASFVIVIAISSVIMMLIAVVIAKRREVPQCHDTTREGMS